MKIFISAAESSSDTHGAELLKSLRLEVARQFPGDALEAFGLGGPKLKAAGLREVWDARSLLAMGFVEVLGKIPTVLRAQKALLAAVQAEKPDIAIFIDYPDFHFRLAKKMRRLGVRHVYYIPPKLWVWRKNRSKQLRRLFDQVLCIFPFEEKFYKALGVPCQYVGNPLLDELPLQTSRGEARQKLAVEADRLVLVAMPGGRSSELKYHFELFLRTAETLAEQLKKAGILGKRERLLVLMPLPLTLSPHAISLPFVSEHSEVRLSFGDAPYCMLAADVGLIKSGTSTLEAGVLGLPHLCVYKPSPSTEWIFKNLIRYRGPVGLVNLVAGQGSGLRLIEEIVCDQVTVTSLSSALFGLFKTGGAEVRARLAELREKLLSPRAGLSPSQLAAQAVLDDLMRARAQSVVSSKQGTVLKGAATLLVSGLWSTVNLVVHMLVQLGVLRSKKLNAFVLSVGNIQAGGAGKTPFVAQVAREAHRKGLNVCILLRGYKGGWERSGGVIVPGGARESGLIEAGDEALLLRELCPFAWIGVGKDRVKSFGEASRRLPPGQTFDLVLLDDGFQNWKIKKDLDLVLLTAALPSQIVYRDFFFSLRWADALIWTKGFPRKEKSVFRNRAAFARLEPRLVAFDGRGFDRAFGEVVRGSNRARWVITGIASPGDLLRLVMNSGVRVSKVTLFEDHFPYSGEQVQGFLKEAQGGDLRILITAKDWMKWRQFGVRSDELDVVDLEFCESEPNSKGSVWDRILCTTS